MRQLKLAPVKRRARKLLDKLIIATKGKDEPAAAQLQRCNAAAGLVMIVEGELDGEQIVARRFVKSATRKAAGTRALLKLSDDELGKFRHQVIGTTSAQTASIKLLDAFFERFR